MIKGIFIINRSTGDSTYIDLGLSQRSEPFGNEICICSDDEIKEGDTIINLKTGGTDYVRSLGGTLGFEHGAGFMYIQPHHKKLESSGDDADMIMELAKQMKPYLAEHRNLKS